MLKETLIRCGAIQFGEFTLTSGKKSNYYIDIKRASTNPTILTEIATAMKARIRELISEHFKITRIAGMELGAVPLAVALSLQLNIPYLIIRKGERTHGTQRKIEGELRAGDTVVVVEDVATTGGSIVSAVNAIRAEGGEVKFAIVVVDREEGATQLLATYNIQLIPLVRASELITRNTTS